MGFFKTTLAAMLGAFLAGFLLLLVFFFILGGLVSDKGPAPVQNAVLKIELSGDIADKGSGYASEFGEKPHTFAGNVDLGLFEMCDILRKAKQDPNIRGIYLRPGLMTAGWSTLSRLRAALLDFRSSGKFIYAWSDMYTEQSYYLATAATRVFIPRQGALELNGLSYHPYFLKGMLDKLGVEAKVFKVGTFKSAVEPYKETQMSPPSRLQMTELLGDFWEKYAQDVCRQRKISREAFEKIVSEFGVWANTEAALKAGLVDDIVYEDAVLAMMEQTPEGAVEGSLNFTSLRAYARQMRGVPRYRARDPKVAVVFAEGQIMDGMGTPGTVSSDRFNPIFRSIRQDTSIKAVVLRINSPGGSALASDLMWNEIREIAKTRPVIASMGDVAASGGYYIAAPCTRIFADTNTITGSIGVFAIMPNVTQMSTEKLGVTWDEVNTHPYAAVPALTRAMTPQEENILQAGVGRMYGRFVQVVQEGRHFPDSLAVDSIAQGRVWSGIDALRIGLVDELGGLDKALAYAVKAAGLSGEQGKDYHVRVFPDDTDPFKVWLQRAAEDNEIDLTVLAPDLRAEIEAWRRLREETFRQGTFMLLPYHLDIR